MSMKLWGSLTDKNKELMEHYGTDFFADPEAFNFLVAVIDATHNAECR